MDKIAFVIGIVAVVVLLLSYQQKKRKNIIAFNITARSMFILQYVLLGAFEGAALDIAAVVASWLAQKKNSPMVKKYLLWVIIGVDLAIVAVGMALYQNIFSLFPIAAVLLQTAAFWLDNERMIRIVSLSGAPFWLIYNLVTHAYGSVVGDVLTIVSIGVAMLRYDFHILKKPETK